ncbi:MAG: hypothetical protein JWP52_4541 [Rhizobacter sp.]|nr:hypothetical protein [Rhizobacter sp.]
MYSIPRSHSLSNLHQSVSQPVEHAQTVGHLVKSISNENLNSISFPAASQQPQAQSQPRSKIDLLNDAQREAESFLAACQRTNWGSTALGGDRHPPPVSPFATLHKLIEKLNAMGNGGTLLTQGRGLPHRLQTLLRYEKTSGRVAQGIIGAINHERALMNQVQQSSSSNHAAGVSNKTLPGNGRALQTPIKRHSTDVGATINIAGPSSPKRSAPTGAFASNVASTTDSSTALSSRAGFAPTRHAVQGPRTDAQEQIPEQLTADTITRRARTRAANEVSADNLVDLALTPWALEPLNSEDAHTRLIQFEKALKQRIQVSSDSALWPGNVLRGRLNGLTPNGSPESTTATAQLRNGLLHLQTAQLQPYQLGWAMTFLMRKGHLSRGTPPAAP